MWCTRVKWWYLHVFFHFFKVFIFWNASGVKGQKWSKMTKNYVVLHGSGTIRHMIAICGAQVLKDNISTFFFFKILIFWVARRVRGQKVSQNDKKLSVSLRILGNHTAYDCGCWYNFVYKMMISPETFFIFSKFWFFRFLGSRKKGKKWPIVTNLSLLHLISQEL